MFFEKDSFFDAFNHKKIDKYRFSLKLPTEGVIIPKCDEKYEIQHLGNTKNFLVKHSNKKFILKAISKKQNYPEKLINVSLSLNNIIKVPQPTKFIDGNYVFEDENFYWTQLCYIDGNSFLGEVGDYFAIMTLIEKLFLQRNEISNKIKTFVKGKSIFYDDVEKQFFKYLEMFREDELFEMLPIDCQKLIKSEFLNSIQIPFNIGQSIPCHIDLHPQNIIIKSDKEVFILDMDSFQNFPIKVAYSFAIFKNFRHMVASYGNEPEKFLEQFANCVVSVFQNKFEPPQILKLAQLEYMRRANNVFFEIKNNGWSKWIENLSVQLAGICETLIVSKRI